MFGRFDYNRMYLMLALNENGSFGPGGTG